MLDVHVEDVTHHDGRVVFVLCFLTRQPVWAARVVLLCALTIVDAAGCCLFGQSCNYSQKASVTHKAFSKQLMNAPSAIHELQQLCLYDTSSISKRALASIKCFY